VSWACEREQGASNYVDPAERIQLMIYTRRDEGNDHSLTNRIMTWR
jgi:hypothetical protein